MTPEFVISLGGEAVKLALLLALPLLGVGLVVTIIVTVFVTRIAKRSLAEALDSNESPEDQEMEGNGDE